MKLKLWRRKKHEKEEYGSSSQADGSPEPEEDGQGDQKYAEYVVDNCGIFS